MKHIPSYATVYALGHRAIAEIFFSPVVIEEKIDGSQISFGVIDGELCCRSKGKDLVLDEPEKMFIKAVATARLLQPLLTPGWVYRGEYLSTPKHNALCYGRVPDGNIILFDVMTAPETYLDYPAKAAEAARIGLEVVPQLFSGTVETLEQFNGFLNRESKLGLCKIEGVVVKNYALFTQEKKVAVGKYVSEAFKEVHRKEWTKSNPSPTDIVHQIIMEYKTPPRWKKAVQHLREAGQLDGSPKDIGPLMREIPDDILKECEGEIKDSLFKHFWPQIRRGVTAGAPEWYKQLLAETSFQTSTGNQ